MRKPERVYFGTSGIPHAAVKRDSISGIEAIRDLDLDAMELEFVRGVRMTMGKAEKVRAQAEKEDVWLTAHGPYYINLNANEQLKIEQSMERILATARVGHAAGAYSIVFHAGFYLGQDPAHVHERILGTLKEVNTTLQDEGVDIWVRPETTGKATQYGTLEEILAISSELDCVLPCIDFSHLHARNGENNTYEEFAGILEKVESIRGREGLENVHFHVSGIEYTDKGEKRHLPLEDSDMEFHDLMKAFRDFGVKGVVICESPTLEGDARLLKASYEKGEGGRRFPAQRQTKLGV